MPNAIEYSQDQELQDAVMDVLNEPSHHEFTSLRDEGVIINSCFCVRVDKDGETQRCKGSPVRVKRVDDLSNAFFKKKAHYILVMDYGTWQESDTVACAAIIHHALMHCDACKDDNGELKHKLRKPDVVTFRATISRYGAWTEVLADVSEAFRKNPHKLLPTVKPAPEPEQESADEEPPRVKSAEEENEAPAPRRRRKAEPEAEPEVELEPEVESDAELERSR